MKIFFTCLIIHVTAMLGSNWVMADAKECANPSELEITSQVKMKFCDVQAAQGVLIGDKESSFAKRRNFKKFQIGQYLVTQQQYKAVTRTTPWTFFNPQVRRGKSYPAVGSTYFEAEKFAGALNQIDKSATYRLPTEAEFEYAARAGTSTNYFWGDDMDSNYAYYRGNTEVLGPHGDKVDSCPNKALGSRLPGYCANGLGLFQMLGNVSEWTEDTLGFSMGDPSIPIDGDEPVKYGGFQVVRGGSWNDDAQVLKLVYRDAKYANTGYINVGFRIVRIAR